MGNAKFLALLFGPLLVLGLILFFVDRGKITAMRVLFLGSLLMAFEIGAGFLIGVYVGPYDPSAVFLSNLCLGLASVGGNLMAAAALFKAQINLSAALATSQSLKGSCLD